MSHEPPVSQQAASPKGDDSDYRLMIESVTDYAIFMLDTNGFIVNWNAGARALKGYEANEVIGRHFSIFYPRELLDRNWTDHELAHAREHGKYEEEGWRVRKDGSRFWASVVITKLVDGEGIFRGFSKITRDLSERRRQEELLRASEERLRLIVESVADYAIFMLDPSGFIVSWNKGAQLTKGYGALEIIGKHFSVFYPPNVVESGWPEEELRRALEHGRFEDEGWRIRKDGSRFWANVIITALFDGEGRHRGFAKVTRDLTERRRNEMLEEEGKRIEAFIAMLAHELRNPLAPIASALSILQRDQKLSESSSRARDVIARQSKQMTRIVDDLLDMGRISQGKFHLDMKPTALDGVIKDAVEMVMPLIDLQTHMLNVDIGETPMWVIGDRARLIQIVGNLLHNAAKFTPQSGHIGVNMTMEHNHAVITVKDDGLGIEPGRLSTIFRRFEQRDTDQSKTFGGLGLGLSLAQELTQLQHGSISAFSTGVAGEGSTFIVRLPLIAAPEAVDNLPSSILVVDDNRDTANVVVMLLEMMGFESNAVYSGLAAIEAIKQARPVAVLLDIGLPDIDGYDVARRINAEILNPPPLIALSGYGQPEDHKNSLDAGFYAHFTKPVDTDRLEMTLKLLLSQR